MKVANEATLYRQNTNQTSQPQQGESRRKMVAYLEVTLKEQIEKRQEAQRMLLEYRQRSLRAQNQFSRLLEKYDNNISLARGKETYSQEIWNKLIDEIQKFNDNSQRMLEKRCNQILYLMNRKINQILEKTDFEIKKTKKLSEEQYRTVKEEIKEALNLARQIELENDQIKRMNKQLAFKVNILREEKTLLVEELNQKKMMIAKMKETYLEPAPNSTSIMSPRPRSTRVTASEIRPAKFMCEPSFAASIEDPEIEQKSQSIYRRKDRSVMMVKTDNHFKLCLEREKKKNNELKALISRLQAKVTEVGLLIDRTHKEIGKLGQQSEVNKKFERLVEQIKIRLVIPGDNRLQMNSSHREILDLIKC